MTTPTTSATCARSWNSARRRRCSDFRARQRLSVDFDMPLHRMRWLNPGESLDAGDRTLHAVLPPLFDSRRPAASSTAPAA
ncbi:hypothetical protein ACU686_15060 [Yinghuangia aomiensis]